MFELRLKDFSKEKRQEMLDIFTKRKELRKFFGGCPPEGDRVKDRTECFHCDECWIAAIENSLNEMSPPPYYQPAEFPCSVYARVLLLDGEIVSFITSVDEEMTLFPYVSLDISCLNKYVVNNNEWYATSLEGYTYIMDNAVPHWYSQWPISEEFEGTPPY